MDRKKDPSDFERAFREWGGREPRTPASVARTRLGARLEQRPRNLGLWRLAVASVGTVVVAFAAWLGAQDVGIAPMDIPVPAPAAGDAAPPLGDDVVLWWLDKDTPVYFVLSPPDSGRGGE
jgi:hypothetical protein